MPAIRCCKDCTKPRFVDGVRCHSTCEEYAKEKAVKEQELKQRYKDNEFGAFRSRNVTRTLRRIGNHRYK